MASNTPLDQHLRSGPLNARRVEDRSNPRIVGALLVVTALGIIAGLLLFGKLMADDLRDRDRARLLDASRIAASRIERLVQQAGIDLDQLVDGIDFTNEAPTADSLRETRRQTVSVLDSGPLSGVIVLDERDEVLFEVAVDERAARVLSTPQPLEADTNLLSDRLWMVASGDARTPLLHLKLRTGIADRLVATFDEDALHTALSGGDHAADLVQHSYLLDQENRLLFSSDPETVTMHARIPEVPYNLTPLEEASVTSVLDSAGTDRLLSIARLGEAKLRIVHVGGAQGGGAVFGRAGAMTAVLVGPALLGIILLISIIQNEWRKADRRSNNASNAVARAQVASDLLQAGIVDWSTTDSSVVYSRGWRDLFGYADGVTGEQVYDWIARLHPDDRAKARLRYQRLMDGDATTADHTLRVLCADGSFTQVRERAAVRKDETGAVLRVILVQTPYVAERAQERAA